MKILAERLQCLNIQLKDEPKSLSISGKIVAVGNKKAETIISEIEALRTGGSLIKYNGRNVLGNYLIKSFHTSQSHAVWGGAVFDMELVEVRIAKSAYDPSKQKAAETKKKTTAPTLEVGAIVVFKGGPVYVSSDAKKAAAQRGRSTCKITIINKRSWSLHDYHLISTDGKMVYGWVDVENIEGTGTSSGTVKTNTSGVTNAGTQQVQTQKIVLKKAGTLKSNLIIGSDAAVKNNTKLIMNVAYILYPTKEGTQYLPYQYLKKMKLNHGAGTTNAFPSGTPYYYREK